MTAKPWPLVITVALLICGCATLAPVPPTPVVTALPAAEHGLLADTDRAIRAAAGSGQSGFVLLSRNDDAMNWRLALIDHAVSAIDAQYFIWQSDAAGFLLFNRLLKAVDRNKDLLAAYPLSPRHWDDKLAQLTHLMHFGEAHFLQDTPVRFGGETHRLADMLDMLAAPSHEELLIFTPYLIPVGDFLEELARLSDEGVKIRILTGSMGSNNHTVAHSHYKKYRGKILAAGAELYEFRHDPSPAVRQTVLVKSKGAPFVSLHIKALVGDRKRCFIGSLNLDPRALVINTENGLYIESEGLSRQMAEQFDALAGKRNAWQVTLNRQHQLRWHSFDGTASSQPARSFWQRIADFFYRLLPIESQL